MDGGAGPGGPHGWPRFAVRGDQHVTAYAYYQNSPILGRLLAERGDRPAGALYLLPLWHPVLLAEQVCAIGGGDAQFAGMGVELRERRSRFEAALDIVSRLLAGEDVSARRGPGRSSGRESGRCRPSRSKCGSGRRRP